MEGIDSCIPTDCTIYAIGNVTCKMPCEFSIVCDESDYTNWPFDVQRCHYSYVPKIPHLNQLSLIYGQVAIDYETGLYNGDWHLRDVSARNEDNSSSVNSSIVINFEIERKSNGIISQILIPAMVMITINISLLLLSPEFNERVVLYCINLLSHTLFVGQLKWM